MDKTSASPPFSRLPPRHPGPPQSRSASARAPAASEPRLSGDIRYLCNLRREILRNYSREMPPHLVSDRARETAGQQLRETATQVASEIMSTASPEALATQPRSNQRVTYSNAGLYTVSSSAPPADPSAEQAHTHLHTDAVGRTWQTSQAYTGSQRVSAQLLTITDNTVHLHLHTFNDPGASAPSDDSPKRPHLYIEV